MAADREERIATFTANGGQCLTCFDQGPCQNCERGRIERAAMLEGERKAWIAATGLPPRFQSFTFATFPGLPAIAAQARDFLASWDGKANLILTGRYGTGKTSILAAMIAELSYGGRRSVVFTTTPRLFDQLRAGFEDGSFAETMGRCQRAGLLILDDLGAEKPSEWVHERLYALVNHRYEHELPIWASTNLPPARLIESIGERVWSRLQEGARLIVATGPNLRERQS